MATSQSTASLVASLSPEVLALLAASYGKRDANEVVERIVVRNAPQAPKARKASKLAAVKADATPVPEKREVPAAYLPIDLPKVGTYDAATFLREIRAIGPIFVGNHSTVDDAQRAQEVCGNHFSFVQRRDAAMKLIAGFVGFDRSRDFGAQLDMARDRAANAMRPAPRKVHRAAVTVSGYVAGMPDDTAKRVGDLLARERLAAETLCEHEQSSKDAMARGDMAGATLAAQLAAVETARLAQIRADLHTMGVR